MPGYVVKMRAWEVNMETGQTLEISSKEIMKRAWSSNEKKLKKKLTVYSCAKNLGIPYGNIYNSMHGTRAWSADKWLEILLGIGALKIENKKITIDLS